MHTTHAGVREDATLNFQEESEVQYVADCFGVTSERVREVALKVGANYKAIQEELSRTDAHASE
jgi:hypothetical protein